jgi:RNA 2',3'-cyclic 3'-phosphodiesterase
MRAFVALEVPDQVLDSLFRFQGELSNTGADLRLVERENLHFTVKFLGEISEAQASEACSKLSKLQLRKMNIQVRGAGAFPSASRARVVWAGVAHENVQQVSSLAAEVISALEGIGERDDRSFQAHVTLGRVRSPRNLRELGDLLARNHDRVFGVAELTEVKLKSSVLTPSGPVYSDVGVFPLQ